MSQPPFDSLGEWLAWQERLHPREIELGLERVTTVAERLQVLQPAPFVITVAGTNGKGSSVAMLAAALSDAGLRTATYTSPHLLTYNERVVIERHRVTDHALCEAFAAVEQARGDTGLTYFEFGTLAALWLIRHSAVDVAILEVGLGGRLDAVNIVDADIALVTNVGLDHQDWLGNDREAIGREKAGIFRKGRSAVYNDPVPVASVLESAANCGAELYCLQRDYRLEQEDGHWLWRRENRAVRLCADNDKPLHQIENAAGVLMCLQLVSRCINLDVAAAGKNLLDRRVAGRSDWRRVTYRGKSVELLLDVAHNLEAVQALAGELRRQSCQGRTLAVFAALVDKPVAEMTGILAPLVDEWLVAGLTCSRGCSAAQTVQRMPVAGNRVEQYASPDDAWNAACGRASPSDRVIVFGSFHTVQAVLEHIELEAEGRTGND